MARLHFSKIGLWSEIKLEIIRRYATEYSKILTSSRQRGIRRHVYIDGFAGSGVHISKTTNQYVPGSPLNALQVVPPFDEYHLVDLDAQSASQLRALTKGNPRVHIYEGDCNVILPRDVFPRVKYGDFARGLCLLDPYGLQIDWKTIKTAGAMRTLDIFVNFMIMDANMNVFRRDKESVSPAQIARMNAAWGDDSWKSAAYSSPQGNFFGDPEKGSNEDVARALQMRLRDVAGFEFVPDPLPMRNSTNSVVYYLYFASHNEAGKDVVEYIFNMFRNRTSD